MADLPAAGVKRLLTKHGNELRTSGTAIDAAVAATEAFVARLAQIASSSAADDRRKTIMDGDIAKARQQLGI
jgi:histone H3/H4